MVVRVYNQMRQRLLMERGQSATDALSRLRGLIGHPPLGPGEGTLLSPCRGVHTFFMRFPIDVVYVDSQGKVVGLAPALQPNRVGPLVPKAQFVLELPAGTIQETGTAVGDELEVQSGADC